MMMVRVMPMSYDKSNDDDGYDDDNDKIIPSDNYEQHNEENSCFYLHFYHYHYHRHRHDDDDDDNDDNKW